MKIRSVSRLVKNIGAVILGISAFIVPVEARTQRILAARTQLAPVGLAPNQLLWFAPGVVWVDDFDGGVQSGTLDQTASVKVWNSNASISFGPGFIRFERSGGVKEGTLPADTQLCVVNTASNSKISLMFRGKKTVEFGYDGCVMKGTLAQETALKSWNGESKTYPAGSLVDFNGAGLVTRAILPPSDPTPQDGNYSGTCTIGGIGAFPFAFRADRGFFSGGRDQTLYSLQWQGNYDKAGTILIGMITGWIDIGTGAQKTRWTVRGPIQGTITPAASKGKFSATAADGNQTWTGSWAASTGAPVVLPCANYFGPIEPLRIAGAGPRQRPGTYWLVYAAVPRSPDPPENWVWKKYGPVTLTGGKRYFILFGRGAEVQMTEDSNLPTEETLVKVTPDAALVWQENDSGNGDRIAYCLQAVHAGDGRDKAETDGLQPQEGEWVLTDTWTAFRATKEPDIAGKVVFPTPTSAVSSSRFGEIRHAWTDPPRKFNPGDTIRIKLGTAMLKGRVGRSYTGVFYGTSSAKPKGLGWGVVMIPSFMDWAGEQPDEGPLFKGSPFSFAIVKKGTEIVVDASLKGYLSLVQDDKAPRELSWTGKAPAPTKDGKFLLIISSGHAVRGTQYENKDFAVSGTLSVGGAAYYEYTWKGK